MILSFLGYVRAFVVAVFGLLCLVTLFIAWLAWVERQHQRGSSAHLFAAWFAPAVVIIAAAMACMLQTGQIQ